MNKFLAHSHLGLTFALFLGGLSYLGLELDERLGTTPLFTILGGFLGFGAGFYHLYRGVYGKGSGGSSGEEDGTDQR